MDVGRMKSRDTALMVEDAVAAPSRVARAGKIADRQERQEALSSILRDGRATGAEAVAAARLLEAMDRNDAAATSRGIPPPTNRPEQVARALRLIAAFGLTVLCDALDLYIARSERQQAVAARNPNQAEYIERARQASLKLRKRRNRTSEPVSGEDFGSEPGTSGTASAEPNGVSELQQSAEPAGEVADEDERNGDRDLQLGAEDGETD